MDSIGGQIGGLMAGNHAFVVVMFIYVGQLYDVMAL